MEYIIHSGYNPTLVQYFVNSRPEKLFENHPIFNRIDPDTGLITSLYNDDFDVLLSLEDYHKLGYIFLSESALTEMFKYKINGRVGGIYTPLVNIRSTLVENVQWDDMGSILDEFPSGGDSHNIDFEKVLLSYNPGLFLDTIPGNVCTTLPITITHNSAGKTNTQAFDPVLWDILDCNNTKIVIPIRIFDELGNGHANIMIIDKDTVSGIWEIDYFEPHGKLYVHIINRVNTLLEEILLFQKFRIYTQEYICPYLELQGRELYSGSGLCQTWILYYVSLRLVNPGISREVIQIKLSSMDPKLLTKRLFQFIRFANHRLSPGYISHFVPVNTITYHIRIQMLHILARAYRLNYIDSLRLSNVLHRNKYNLEQFYLFVKVFQILKGGEKNIKKCINVLELYQDRDFVYRLNHPGIRLKKTVYDSLDVYNNIDAIEYNLNQLDKSGNLPYIKDRIGVPTRSLDEIKLYADKKSRFDAVLAYQ